MNIALPFYVIDINWTLFSDFSPKAQLQEDGQLAMSCLLPCQRKRGRLSFCLASQLSLMTVLTEVLTGLCKRGLSHRSKQPISISVNEKDLSTFDIHLKDVFLFFSASPVLFQSSLWM